jgi:hypothetical protein
MHVQYNDKAEVNHIARITGGKTGTSTSATNNSEITVPISKTMVRNVVTIISEYGKHISFTPDFVFFTENGANPSSLEI